MHGNCFHIFRNLVSKSGKLIGSFETVGLLNGKYSNQSWATPAGVSSGMQPCEAIFGAGTRVQVPRAVLRRGYVRYTLVSQIAVRSLSQSGGLSIYHILHSCHNWTARVKSIQSIDVPVISEVQIQMQSINHNNKQHLSSAL